MSKKPYTPPARQAQMNAAVELMNANKIEAAEAAIRAVLADAPKEFAAWNILGVLLKRQRNMPNAINAFEMAHKLQPNNPSPMFNLGNSYADVYNYEKAAEYYGKCLRIAPKESEHHRLHGLMLEKLGQTQKAIASIQNAAMFAPKDLRPKVDLCSIFLAHQRFDDALKAMDSAIAMAPLQLQMYVNKAVILNKMGRQPEALALLDDVIEKHPNEIDLYIAQGNFYHYDLGDFEGANGYYERAYQIAPDNVHLLVKYCECLLNSRYGSEAAHIQRAYEIAKRILTLGPVPVEYADGLQKVFLRTADYGAIEQLGDRENIMKFWLQRMNVGALHNQLGRVNTMDDRTLLVTLHGEWGKQIESKIMPLPAPAKIRTQGSKMRIALMSSDLRDHPVTYFTLPIIQFFNRNAFEILCYSFYPKAADNVQQYIAKHASAFHVMPSASDRQVAQHMQQEGVDILFELGGSTFLNKVQVCSHRPAPVCVSWLGYPHSVGLSRIDYIVTDPYITPPEPGLLIEKPFELPQSWVTLGNIGFPNVPIEAGTPQGRNGYITFGTANNPYKYTPKVLETWGKILAQVPNSRMLFVRPEGGTQAFCDNIIKEFAKQGITAERIMFEPIRGKHLPHYNRIDVSLDPFPHTGGTTTCETLWMGVPCVTLVGPAFFERLSYSNNSNAGLGDLCTFSVEDYINTAVKLSQDTARIDYLRHNLRTQIRANPLGLQEHWVRGFERKTYDVLNVHKVLAA